MVKISNRLTTAAALVTQGYTLADVGTDHGYIPIYLLQQKKIPSAIAMDINEGPLERAKEHIALYGLQAYIQTRLSDGVVALKPGEVEAVLIAGMGGGLIMHILKDGERASVLSASGSLSRRLFCLDSTSASASASLGSVWWVLTPPCSPTRAIAASKLLRQGASSTKPSAKVSRS